MTLSSTVHEGLDLLIGLKDTDRALVATVDLDGQLVVQALHGMSADSLGEKSPVSVLLSQTIKAPKPLLVLDSEQETMLAMVPSESKKEMRSALCVPMLDGKGELVGILYADSSARVANYSYGDLSKVQTACEGLAPRVALARTQPRPKVVDTVVEPKHLATASALMVAGLLWFLIGAGASGPKVEPPAPPPARISLNSAGPLQVSSSFFEALRRHDYLTARSMLGERLQAGYPEDKFALTVDKWLKEGNGRDNRMELNRRRPREGTGVVSGEQAQVIFDRPDHPTWTVSLRRESNGWKITKMEGGPFAPIPETQTQPETETFSP